MEYVESGTISQRNKALSIIETHKTPERLTASGVS